MVKTIRTRFFMAVEGEGEQGFVKWLQMLTDNKKISIHLDTLVLNGGGYKTMLDSAITERKKKR